MEDLNIVIERHEQALKILERDVCGLKAVQSEIRTMNESLLTLATELKHTNEHLSRHEKKIEEIEKIPSMRLQQIIAAVISAVCAGIITFILSKTV